MPVLRLRRLARGGGWSPVVVALLVVAAALLRFVTLADQSFYYDEVATARLVGEPFTSMLRDLPESEGTPPLYYLLAWLWSRIFGDGEFALRSLSAVIGTATVPLAYLVGLNLRGRGVGLIAATLTAVSPLLVWYSQEARAYTLFAFLSLLGVLWFLRILRDPSRRNVAWWAGVSILTILTHYFGLFPVAVEAAWLLVTRRRPVVLLGVAAPVVAGLALVPLVHKQYRGGERAQFIADFSLHSRVSHAAQEFLAGEKAVPHGLWIAALGILAVLASALLARSQEDRRAILVPAVVALAAVGLSLALVPVVDRFYYRNVIFAWPLLSLALAAALLPSRFPKVALAATLCACAALVATNVYVFRTPHLHRDDWRSLARALPSARGAVVVVAPAFEWKSAAFYDHDLTPPTGPGRTVTTSEIDVIGYELYPGPFPPRGLRIPAGFMLRERTSFAPRPTALRFRSDRPRSVRLSSLVAGPATDVSILLRSSG